MSTTKIKVVFLRVSQLLTHPRNMRRFYLKDDVEQMARSICARKGVLQALRVVRVKGKRGLYPLWMATCASPARGRWAEIAPCSSAKS